MAVKRRRSKRLLTPLEEMSKWSLYWECGRDYTDEINDILDPYRPMDAPGSALDDLSPQERDAVVKEAWGRLGRLFLESEEVQRKTRDDPGWKPWALLKYGSP